MGEQPVYAWWHAPKDLQGLFNNLYTAKRLGADRMSAKKDLYNLYSVAKSEENSLEYINELIEQIRLFGLEGNSLTKQFILDKLQHIVLSVKFSLNN